MAIIIQGSRHSELEGDCGRKGKAGVLFKAAAVYDTSKKPGKKRKAKQWF